MSTHGDRAQLVRQLAANGWSEAAIADAMRLSVEQVRLIRTGWGAPVLVPATEQAEATAADDNAIDRTTCAEGNSMSKAADDEIGIGKFLSLEYRGNRQASDRAYWTKLLRLTGGNVTAAAELAGYSREHAHRIIRRLNIERPRPGPGAWKRLREGRKALDSVTSTSQISSADLLTHADTHGHVNTADTARERPEARIHAIRG